MKKGKTKKKKIDISKLKRFDLKRYLGISELKDDCAVLRNGNLLAVMLVKPIKFEKMADKKKEKVVCAYRRWLSSLNYPVQIIARTVNENLDEQLSIFRSVTDKDIKGGDDFKELLNRFRDFSTWLKERAVKCRTRRLYYLVIPYLSPCSNEKELKQDYEGYLKKLNKRVKECKEMLEKTGVNLRRLSDDELENFYHSYFNMHFLVSQNKAPYYINADKWLKIWKSEAKED